MIHLLTKTWLQYLTIFQHSLSMMTNECVTLCFKGIAILQYYIMMIGRTDGENNHINCVAGTVVCNGTVEEEQDLTYQSSLFKTHCAQ